MTSAVGRANDKVAHIIAVLVFRHMRWMLPLGVMAGVFGLGGLCACTHGPSATTGPQPPAAPGGPGTGTPSGLPGTDPSDGRLELPSTPARIEVTTSAPTDANTPDKRSPVLDVLKAESEREMAALGKQKDPAYYL